MGPKISDKIHMQQDPRLPDPPYKMILAVTISVRNYQFQYLYLYFHVPIWSKINYRVSQKNISLLFCFIFQWIYFTSTYNYQVGPLAQPLFSILITILRDLYPNSISIVWNEWSLNWTVIIHCKKFQQCRLSVIKENLFCLCWSHSKG